VNRISRWLASAVCLCAVAYSFPAQRGAADDREGSFVAPPDKALLVFVRTSKMYKRRDIVIVDDKVRAHARFEARQHATTLIEPGQHKFYVVAQKTERFDLEAGAGRTYVVLVRVNMGAGNVRAVPDPIQRSEEDFDTSAGWIRDTKPSSLGTGLEEWAAKNKSNLEKRIADANENWNERGDEWHAAHSLRTEDGRTAEEAGKI